MSLKSEGRFMGKDAYLVLENGRVFSGKSFGAVRDVVGEIVFTTAMTGYLETLTDPSYYGQMVVQTFPLIGNYGVIPSDFESSDPKLKAYIVREWCQEPSNFRSEGDLDTFLKTRGIVGIYGIDTRELTRIIREHGVMNAKIKYVQDVDKADMEEIRSYRIEDAVNSVTCNEVLRSGKNGIYNVVMWDFGAKGNIERELLRRDCNVTIVPSVTTASEIVAMKPDGIMLSNGPGDPAENVAVIEEIKKLCKHKIPTFGICLGHQLIALSQGANTGKLKYGHRGANQPVKETSSGRVYISTQNHGYAVDTTLPDNARMSFINANDGTCEGIEYTDMPCFTVQFHPEASAGPLDTEFLFDRFIELMKGAGR